MAVAVNVLSLRRTVRHSRQNRIDARTDKLRGEIAAFISALSERPPMAEIWKKRLEEIGRPTNPAALADWARNVRPLVEEMLAPMYQRISAHAFGILMLTDDENITAPVHRLEQLTIDEITDART